METEKPRRSVQLPYRFGDTIYLRGRQDCVPGTVCAFEILPAGIKVCITWSDHPYCQSQNFLCELSEDYEPTFGPRNE
jgi:hypothetical protein